MLEGVQRWLLQSASTGASTAELLDELWRRVREAGIPVERTLVALRTIHPQIVGLGYVWQPERGVRCDEHPHGELSQPRFVHSPLRAIFEERRTIHHALTGESPLPFAVLEELRQSGMTDYLGLPLPFSDGRVQALTLATRRPEGFTADEVRALSELAEAVAVVVELREIRRVAVTLLDTYVGPRAGAKILEGWVRGGDLELIDAVVLCGDLRGFTPMALELSPREVVALLNDYFDTVCAPLRDAGGEILKFIGDGVLAAFPYQGDVAAACRSALAGTASALAALDALPPRRVRGRELRLRMGIALHLGQVAFGNVGSSTRLDFTVIGHAVNVASRLAGLCSRLERTLLVSSAFAREVPDGAIDAGTHSVRGLPSDVSVFTYDLSRLRR